MKIVLGTILIVSIRKLSAPILKTFCRRLDFIVPGTGSWALLHRFNSVNKRVQNILPKQLNSSVFA